MSWRNAIHAYLLYTECIYSKVQAFFLYLNWLYIFPCVGLAKFSHSVRYYRFFCYVNFAIFRLLILELFHRACTCSIKRRLSIYTGPKFWPITPKIAIMFLSFNILEWIVEHSMKTAFQWHQSCASAGIWHFACSLRMRKHTKPLKCTCNSRNYLNRNSNHRSLKNNVFALKWH